MTHINLMMHLTVRQTPSCITSTASTTVIFLAKLKKTYVWGADIGNTYLEATTKKKLYIVGGPEFQELEGHILVIH